MDAVARGTVWLVTILCAALGSGVVRVGAASAQAVEGPLGATVRVVPPPGGGGPPPTGRIEVRLDGRLLLSQPLTRGSVPLLAGSVDLAGRDVTVSYSGDENYDPSGGVTVTVPSQDGVTIVARPIDVLAPVVTIRAPGDGARYARDEVVVASYSCADAGGTAGGVTRCEGTVASGRRLDTSTVGTHRFRVDAGDDAGNTTARELTYVIAPPVTAPGTAAPAPAPAAAPAAAPAPPGPRTSELRLSDVRDLARQVLPPAGQAGAAQRTPPPPLSGSAGTVGDARRASPPAGPAPRAPARAASAADPGAQSITQLASYDPSSEPEKVVGFMVAAFTLLRVGMGRGGLAAAGGSALLAGRSRRRRREGRRAPRRDSGRRPDSAAPEFDMGYEGVDVEQLEVGAAVVMAGDRSRTWGWPGTRIVDAVSAAVPAALAARSPLLARVTADGSYLRAMLGSAAVLALLAGVALGVAAVNDTGGEALPPALLLTIAITVLGIVDAAAGFAAVLTFAAGVAVLGGIDSEPAVRTLLGLAALWFVVPVLAGAARPLRRPRAVWLEDTWDRAADFVIGSLIGAWAVQQIVLALPGLAGLALPIADHADSVAISVLIALVVRLSAETLAAYLYPERLAEATPRELPEAGPLPRLGGVALRTAIFLFLAIVAVGSSWQLWVGTAMFVTPQILGIVEDRLPNSAGLFRALPKGLVELVLMLLVASALGALLIHAMDENADGFLATSFVILSVPGFVLALLGSIGREGDEREIGWPARLAGVGLLALGIMLVVGLLF